MRQLKITKQVTNRETASLDKYLQEIGKVDLITADEEVELAQRIKAGDQVALEKLTKANLRFVVSVAKQYQNQGLTLPDLINEGNLGLIKAAQRFDETRGFKFISYAVWWIRQSILQALAEQSRIVRLPLNKIGSINKINKIEFIYYFFCNYSYCDILRIEEFIESYGINYKDLHKLLTTTNSLMAGSSALYMYLKQEQIETSWEPNDMDIWVEDTDQIVVEQGSYIQKGNMYLFANLLQ